MDLSNYSIKQISTEKLTEVLLAMEDVTQIDLGVCNVMIGKHPAFGEVVLVNTIDIKNAIVLPFDLMLKLD